MRVVVCAAALAACALAGCGSGDDGPPSLDPATSIGYGSLGTTSEIDCQGRILAVTGSNNTLRVRGTCAAIRVEGADNTINAERIETELVVSGLNNTVNYAEGDPHVSDSGSGNRIGTP